MLERHPHYPRWVAGLALVLDGVAFARSGGARSARHVTGAGVKERLLANSSDKEGSSILSRQGKDVKKERKKTQKVKTASSDGSKGKGPRLTTTPTTTAAAAAAATAEGADTAAVDKAKKLGGRWVHVHD